MLVFSGLYSSVNECECICVGQTVRRWTDGFHSYLGKVAPQLGVCGLYVPCHVLDGSSIKSPCPGLLGSAAI